jgi:uncharacterized lipoprotein YmbA
MRWWVVATSALWVACASAPQVPTLFSLRAAEPAPSGRLDAPLAIVLERVEVAPYLQTAGIVVETAAGQVRPARAYQWAEPLEAGLRSSLRARISSALGYPVSSSPAALANSSLSVVVHVDRLHGTMDGAALVEASFRITPLSSAEPPVEVHFSRVTPLENAGYAGLVEAEMELIDALAVEIADALRGLGAP